MLIAPCTASTIGKMANGIADNMLVTTYLSMKAPVFIAPAMDLDMYKHPTTQRNLETLRYFGNIIIEPASGFLASGLTGKGRMQEPDIIVEELDRALDGNEPANADGNDLKGKKILITAGPTYEKIDPVRFIGNYSSGKMGFAIAEECRRRGADVTLITGPVSLKCHPAVRRIDIESCRQMYEAATEQFKDMDAAILSAAVADFRPEQAAEEKIKREGNTLTLTLQATNDIAAALGKMKTPKQRLVVFALETNNEEENARKKLVKKNADFVVLNSTRNEGTTFGSDNNQISIISNDGKTDYDKKSKADVARDIVDRLAAVMR